MVCILLFKTLYLLVELFVYWWLFFLPNLLGFVLLTGALRHEGFQFLYGFTNLIEFLIRSRRLSLGDLISRFKDFIYRTELALSVQFELRKVVIEGFLRFLHLCKLYNQTKGTFLELRKRLDELIDGCEVLLKDRKIKCDTEQTVSLERCVSSTGH